MSPSLSENMNHGIKDLRFMQILMEIDIEKDYLTFNLTRMLRVMLKMHL